jgi:hypothetical protein
VGGVTQGCTIVAGVGWGAFDNINEPFSCTAVVRKFVDQHSDCQLLRDHGVGFWSSLTQVNKSVWYGKKNVIRTREKYF